MNWFLISVACSLGLMVYRFIEEYLRHKKIGVDLILIIMVLIMVLMGETV